MIIDFSCKFSCNIVGHQHATNTFNIFFRNERYFFQNDVGDITTEDVLHTDVYRKREEQHAFIRPPIFSLLIFFRQKKFLRKMIKLYNTV